MRNILSSAMEWIKLSVIWFDITTRPMVAWKYGEDGKYRHILLGLLASILLLVYTLISALYFGVDGSNFTGNMLLILEFGIMIEVAQMLLGGKNTFWQSFFDASWVGVGGLPVSLFMVDLGISRWVH